MLYSPVHQGLLRGPVTSPHTTVNIQTPCGVVSAQVQVDMSSGVPRTGRVQIESVPSFVVQTGTELNSYVRHYCIIK